VTKSFQYFDSITFFRVRLESVACEFDSRFPTGHFIRLYVDPGQLDSLSGA
jgi:hypothetical protein